MGGVGARGGGKGAGGEGEAGGETSTGFEGADGTLLPTALRAATVNVYSVP